MPVDVSQIPLSLYIHMPWCVKKCPYCDFNSHAAVGNIPEEAYIEQLIKEWDSKQQQRAHRPLHSIFIGGGTPSLIRPALLKKLLQHILQSVDMKAEDLEITMEANPGTVDQRYFMQLPQTGINRLSLGVQSFNDKHLRMLGRIHQAQDAADAILLAKKSGFDNINIDLMHGLPGQTLDEACNDIQQAIDSEVAHISWYQLTIEANTFFARYPPKLPNDDALHDINQAGANMLEKAGYKGYEISAYSQHIKNKCQHNLNYWRFGDYIGIGAGAHSKISSLAGDIKRLANPRHPRRYLQQNFAEYFKKNKKDITNNTLQRHEKTAKIAGKHHHDKLLNTDDLIIEFMLCTLRLHESIPYKLFEERTGILWDAALLLPEKIKQGVDNGLLVQSTTGIETTARGKRFLNELLEYFV